MKNYLFLFLLFIQLSHFCQNYDLKVTIKNIQEINGFIQIRLYNNAKEIPQVNKEYQRFYFKVTDNKMTYTIKNLKQGNYAIATYHDLNSDKICNRNIIGYPTEDFGFSNNVKLFLAPPTFSSALIELNNNKSIEIALD